VNTQDALRIQRDEWGGWVVRGRSKIVKKW